MELPFNASGFFSEDLIIFTNRVISRQKKVSGWTTKRVKPRNTTFFKGKIGGTQTKK